MSMSKGIALILIFVFLTALCLIATRPAFADEASIGNSWAEKAPMNQARAYLGVAVVNGKIYALGGSNEEASGGSQLMPAQSFSGGIIGSNEKYDLSTNNWIERTPMPTSRMNFAIATYQNKIYCIGGNDNYNSWVGVNEVYYPSTNTWETKAPMPTPRSMLQANVVDGKIYCIGGLASNGQYSTTNEVYDPATNTWSTKSSMPSPTGNYVSAVFDNKIYIIGGFNGYAGVDLNQIYDPQNDSWSLGAPPPVGEISAGAATVGVMAPERIYCFSGRTQIYDPENDSWSLGSPVPVSRGGFAVANVNDQLYVIGGVTFTADLNGDISSKTPFALNEQYTPVGYGTVIPTISVASPQNATYSSSKLSLNFTLNKPVDWMGYSLDGQQKATLTSNTTLIGLSNGLHNITVYANDTYGNMGASETVTFRVDVPEPFPTALVATASGASAAAVCLGLLVYFKKRKH
jgi:hypothetical protein